MARHALSLRGGRRDLARGRRDLAGSRRVPILMAGRPLAGGLATVAALALVAALASCSSSGSSAGTTVDTTGSASSSDAPAATTTTTPTAGTATTAAAGAGARFYVSLGDSYAAGYQPGQGSTTDGFAYQLVDEAGAQQHPLELANFACSGATTTSVLNDVGCPNVALGVGAAPYDSQTQIEAAEAFLQTHPGQVDLITVSIGGNDVTRCAQQSDPVPCVTNAVSEVSTNLTTIVQRLRAAAGPDVLIVGTTYPDVLLGSWVSGDPSDQQLATLSVTAFKSLINPTLQKAYESVGGQFVDVTAASGAYGSMTDTTTVDPYGVIPVPVAQVCDLTYYCALHDIHPNADGYKLIADLVLQAYLASPQAG
jgi:lysophospholipase L1-like esterase